MGISSAPPRRENSGYRDSRSFQRALSKNSRIDGRDSLSRPVNNSFMQYHCSQDLQIKTLLAGAVLIGRVYTASAPNFVLADEPEALLFAMESQNMVQTIGSYRSKPGTERYNSFVQHFPRPWPTRLYRQNTDARSVFSVAPLRDVVIAKVYHQPGTTGTRGILFEYQNGAQRTVGEVRIGVDDFITYHNPKSVRILPASFYLWRNDSGTVDAKQVVFSIDPDAYSNMSGFICFWLNLNEMHIEFRDSLEERTFTTT